MLALFLWPALHPRLIIWLVWLIKMISSSRLSRGQIYPSAATSGGWSAQINYLSKSADTYNKYYSVTVLLFQFYLSESTKVLKMYVPKLKITDSIDLLCNLYRLLNYNFILEHFLNPTARKYLGFSQNNHYMEQYIYFVVDIGICWWEWFSNVPYEAYTADVPERKLMLTI